MGPDDALTIRELLQAQDWAPFEARYQAGGRSPYASDAVLGLVRYGMLNGVSSRRGREGLARRDLGCLWITGGRCPDQASIGRFTQLHEESLTGDFVTELTRPVLPVTGTGVGPVAGDGPVVQATASNDYTIKLEAATQAEPAETVTATLEQRTADRQAKGKAADGLSISPVEPEAVVQQSSDSKPLIVEVCRRRKSYYSFA